MHELEAQLKLCDDDWTTAMAFYRPRVLEFESKVTALEEDIEYERGCYQAAMERD